MLRKPGDVAETRGFALKVRARPKMFKRLATRDALHGSRPNLRQRDPGGRIVPTPSDATDQGASTKRCAPREKIIIISIIHRSIHVPRDTPLGLGLDVDLTQKNGRSIRRKPPKNPKKCLEEKNCKHCFYLVLD